MKTIAKVYLSNRECSVQETVYHILPELKLRRIFPAVYFVNANLLEERVHILISEKELSGLPGDTPNIFEKSNIGKGIRKGQVQHSAIENKAFYHYNAKYLQFDWLKQCPYF